MSTQEVLAGLPLFAGNDISLFQEGQWAPKVCKISYAFIYSFMKLFLHAYSDGDGVVTSKEVCWRHQVLTPPMFV